jgi:hypothetical protein
LFFPLRWLERWLHQHLFKVGWLVTKNLHTTTILYYTFFLPGVALNQFVYWFVAGILNVRAERAIAWPEAQAIGELRLNFIRLARGTGRLKLAVISTAPFVAGLIAIWFITNNVLNVQGFLNIMHTGTVDDVSRALSVLTSTPDFWLWIYIAFTISNTMMPDFGDLKGWWLVLGIIAAVIAALFLIGAGDEILIGRMYTPMSEGLSILAGTFAVIIAIDSFVLGVLGASESIIERITGDSATFQNGKMITMRREEILKLREQERAKQARQQARRAAAPAGPPSVYKLSLPIPEAPGREEVLVRRDEGAGLPAGATAPTPAEGRAGPAMISGQVISKPESPAPAAPAASATSPTAPRPAAPAFGSTSPSTPAGAAPPPVPKPAAPGVPSSPSAPKPPTAPPFGSTPQSPAAPKGTGSTPPTLSPRSPGGSPLSTSPFEIKKSPFANDDDELDIEREDDDDELENDDEELDAINDVPADDAVDDYVEDIAPIPDSDGVGDLPDDEDSEEDEEDEDEDNE